MPIMFTSALRCFGVVLKSASRAQAGGSALPNPEASPASPSETNAVSQPDSIKPAHFHTRFSGDIARVADSLGLAGAAARCPSRNSLGSRGLLSGTIDKLAGTISKLAGTISKLAGTIYKPAGTIYKPAGAIYKPAGTIYKPAGSI